MKNQIFDKMKDQGPKTKDISITRHSPIENNGLEGKLEKFLEEAIQKEVK